MPRIAFIGDEVTGAGFRLAGVRLIEAGTDALPERITAARGACDILMITTEYARRLPPEVFDDLTGWEQPLVVFVPDIPGAEAPLDLGRLVRRELGIEA